MRIPTSCLKHDCGRRGRRKHRYGLGPLTPKTIAAFARSYSPVDIEMNLNLKFLHCKALRGPYPHTQCSSDVLKYPSSFDNRAGGDLKAPSRFSSGVFKLVLTHADIISMG